MKSIYQTKFGPVDGNCFAACLASILECDIKEVDIPISNDISWLSEYGEFLKPRGIVLMQIPCNKEALPATTDVLYVIVQGMNRKGTCHHACVAELKTDYKEWRTELEIVHDPMLREESLSHNDISSITFVLNSKSEVKL